MAAFANRFDKKIDVYHGSEFTAGWLAVIRLE
ncbi:hypothetical protein HDF09_001818 [Edaphobacter lichenicola]|uniref:Uncharacterized protein n=1 Tax=Tunturiibacter empetritectus TaxID=3069691 RepID=A0A7W8IH85_9BACT|nr:hypothetical protein [Edaphobacter lichenicola]